jgi:hypothetical protein
MQYNQTFPWPLSWIQIFFLHAGGEKKRLRNLPVQYSNMVLYRTLFNAYGHMCITKVYDEWQLGGGTIPRVPQC